MNSLQLHKLHKLYQLQNNNWAKWTVIKSSYFHGTTIGLQHWCIFCSEIDCVGSKLYYSYIYLKLAWKLFKEWHGYSKRNATAKSLRIVIANQFLITKCCISTQNTPVKMGSIWNGQWNITFTNLIHKSRLNNIHSISAILKSICMIHGYQF